MGLAPVPFRQGGKGERSREGEEREVPIIRISAFYRAEPSPVSISKTVTVSLAVAEERHWCELGARGVEKRSGPCQR